MLYTGERLQRKSGHHTPKRHWREKVVILYVFGLQGALVQRSVIRIIKRTEPNSQRHQ